MVGLYAQTTFDLNPRASSIDTPLHSFVPAKHVDHTHPNAVISVAAADNGEQLTREIYGDDVVWTNWQRPGFELGLELQKVVQEHPNAKGVILGGHGLINWHDDDKSCYELSLELIERAAQYIESKDVGEQTFGGEKFQSLEEQPRRAALVAILPWLRGQVSQNKRFIGTIQDDEKTLRFVNSVDAPRLAELGTSCPDHFLRTKIKPLYVDWNPQTDDVAALKEKLAEGIAKYRADYAAYYEACKHADSPAMRDANPTVILIPGSGFNRVGQRQIREPRDRRVLRLRHRSDARRAGHRQLYRAAAARSVRHRILAAGRSQVAADAAKSASWRAKLLRLSARAAVLGVKSRIASRPKARTSCASI